MRVVSVVSTKGGVGKTTVAANLGGLLADAGLRVLLLDLDSHPTLSNYYALSQKAVPGAYELIALNLTTPAQIVSRAVIAELDMIVSNDAQGQLNTLLLHAPGGRLRLRNLLDDFRPRYDLILIDTQGACSVLLEMAILACDIVLSARMIISGLRETFAGATNILVLDTVIPDRVAYLNAASLGLPVHRIETRRSYKQRSPSALEIMQALAIELFPEWREAISRVSRYAGLR